MEREPILSMIPPTDVAQPLIVPSIVDEPIDEVSDTKLQYLNQIIMEPATDIKNVGNPHFAQPPPILLSIFPRAHEDLAEGNEGDEEYQAAYQSLPDGDNDSALYEFLVSLGITRQFIDDAHLPWKALSKQYQNEFSCVSWLKWSSLDHALEKNLQWPLLSPSDVGLEDQEKCDYRARPSERSILLQTSWGLTKAYAVRGFVQGLEMGLLKSVHYFIYAMLAYRLEELVTTGRTQFEELQAIFEGSSQKGIDSLVRSLAQLDTQWLKLILAAPLIIGVLQGIGKIRNARSASIEERQKIADRIKWHLIHRGSFWWNVILEETPLLSNFLSLSNQVQKLEQWVRWDGRLDHQSRKQAFELIRRVAREGKKITQLNALESLAKIAHGIGLKDLRRLQRAGYSPEALTNLLYIKATALDDLEALSQKELLDEKISKSAKIVYQLAFFPRRLCASYFLWWLGQSTSWWTQRLPFALLKVVKPGLEVLFLQKIAASILEAINCPDKPGFKFGNGYEDWASDYTAECFTTRISLFRTINTNESVDSLVSEILHYHLTELKTLDLSFKYLTSKEASQIIQTVVQQGASLQTLDLSYNPRLSELNEGMLSGLGQLTSLDLRNNKVNVLSENVFSRLSQLTYLNLWFNQISILNKGAFNGLGQLTYLSLASNQISILNEGAFNGLGQLTYLSLENNQISILNEGVFGRLSQLTNLNLWFNQISVLSEGVFSGLSQLTTLDLYWNQISVLNEGVFSGLSQLTTLDLHWNQISVLNEGVFSGLSQLTNLYLYDNQISVLSEGVFTGLHQLTILTLSYNQISLLSEAMFSGLSQLQTLDISSNQIGTLPQNFSTLLPVSLKSLWVGSNTFIPSVLTQEFMQYFPFQLTTLALQSSLIENITEGSFSDFSALTTLYLDHNQISVLSDGAFSGLSQLTSLYLDYNQISVLSEGVLSGLSQLTSLHLDGNQISVLSEGLFSGLSQLTSLHLDGNQISVLSEGVFSGLSQLTELYLWSNRISALSEGVFSGLSQLTSLDLDYNQISVLSEGLFSGLSQLTSLHLDGNQISVLSEGLFSGLNQLTFLYLYLDYNQISILNEGVFSRLSQLTVLYLSGNQLNDAAIQNLTQNFPYQLNQLDVSYNQIGNDGALALAKILPCANLTFTYISFIGNPANDTTLAVAAQQTTLQKVCDDQRCHANLPATESCSMNSNPSITAQMTWGLFGSASEVDEAELDSPDYSYWPRPAKTLSFQSVLALTSTTSESSLLSFTTKTAGAMILGVAGLSILFYKNSTWMQAIVSTGSRFFQRCWDGGKKEEAQITLPTHSVSRYAFFPHLSASSVQRVSTVTVATDIAPR